ncbi:MAG: metallophosphoesterase [Bacteroidales bacterium]|nr:metallophosphoesterase [Bacteroidales bacterium]
MRTLLPILFLLIALGILAGANIYLSRRFSWYFEIENIKITYLVFAFLTVFMIGGLIGFSNSRIFLGSMICSAAAITMGLLLYLFLSVLLTDVIHLFVKLPLKIFGLSFIILTILVSLYGIWNSFQTKVTEIQIPIKGLQSEVRAMHISDVHIGHFRGKAFLQKIVDKTNHHRPDVIFLTGDLFDGKIRLSQENISPLKKIKVPVYFVNGNHDGYSGVETIKEYLRNINVRVLENEIDHFGELQIIGLNHMRSDPDKADMHAAPGGLTIRETLASLKINKAEPTILLHHSPDGIEYADQYGVDLYLAGHTHAGQLFPIIYLNELLFKFNRGLHQFNNTSILVSQGVGTFGPPMRIGTKSEIIFIRLKPES